LNPFASPFTAKIRAAEIAAFVAGAAPHIVFLTEAY
jgi:hypothetical protein